MEPKIKHRWDLTPSEALKLQVELAKQVSVKSVLRWEEIKLVAGIDVAYSRISAKSYAAVIVFDFKRREPIVSSTAILQTNFPYLPGLLSFRESPAVISALRSLKLTPDIIVCDGQGIAHPRGFGLASHLGVIYDLPAIGCAKTILFGVPEKVSGTPTKTCIKLLHPVSKNTIGCLLRSTVNRQPVVISAGHKISLSLACRIIRHFCGKYRIPEIIRQPHLLSTYLRMQDNA
ncbi:MAG: endonuclease V [Candidatus Sumerlaeia bacterium]|nr:endonuclease V [Candidatus Sumerlaeia bacterium]